MFTYKSVIRSHKVYIKQLLQRSVCAFLIACFLTISTPAAPATIVGTTIRTWQDIRFAFLSSQLAIDFPNWVGAFTGGLRKSRSATQISYIRIFPGAVTLEQGQEMVFAAVAYDSDNEPLSGVDFRWTSTDTGRGRAARPFNISKFRAGSPGTYAVKARAGNREAEITVVVTPRRNVRPANTPTYSTSSRTGRSAQPIVETDESGTSTERDENIDKKSVKSKDPVTELARAPGEGWDDTNWLSADDPGNQTGNPPGMPADDGAGNGNFQLSAPVVSLPGRGIDLALNLNYNSRLWNKSGSQVTYDIDFGYPAPGWSLGFGRIMSMGSQGGCMLLDADGTRHGYSGSISTWSSGMSFTGRTSDGSFIDYGCSFTYGSYGSGWAKLPNGTTIYYSTAHSGNTHVVPTRITDAQGNYITITYQNRPGENIETITDTMGRVITFHYDASGRLIEVRAPRMQDQNPIYGSGATRTLIRIHYKQLTLNYSFAGGVTPVVYGTGSPWVIDSIYYPATNTGYWFNDADSYSSYGMIAKVVEQREMSWSAGPDEQGTVTPGQMTKRAEYNYPLTTANQSGRTNGFYLSDAPTYETLTESWAAADIADPAVTRYKIQQSASPRTTSVIQPNGTLSKQYSYNTPTLFTDGLVYSDETYVPDENGTFTFADLGLSGNFKRVAQSNVTWAAGQYDSPRPAIAEIWDENNNKVSTQYEYGSGKFNQITRSCDYDNANVLLRCATAEYENDPSYIGYFH
ncbi:MAG: RHS repeat protein, partial [Blastocatellia bacterium]|nr:RHS repeat protein [Blastocatellia bacterium]